MLSTGATTELTALTGAGAGVSACAGAGRGQRRRGRDGQGERAEDESVLEHVISRFVSQVGGAGCTREKVPVCRC